MLRYPAGHNTAEMAEIRRHIQRHAMPGNPARDAHPDGADLGLLPRFPVHHPNANAAFAPFPHHAEMRERQNQPFLQPRHKGADIARRDGAMGVLQIQQHIAGALARPVIGPLPAAPGFKHGKAGVV